MQPTWPALLTRPPSKSARSRWRPATAQLRKARPNLWWLLVPVPCTGTQTMAAPVVAPSTPLAHCRGERGRGVEWSMASQLVAVLAVVDSLRLRVVSARRVPCKQHPQALPARIQPRLCRGWRGRRRAGAPRAQQAAPPGAAAAAPGRLAAPPAARPAGPGLPAAAPAWPHPGPGAGLPPPPAAARRPAEAPPGRARPPAPAGPHLAPAPRWLPGRGSPPGPPPAPARRRALPACRSSPP